MVKMPQQYKKYNSQSACVNYPHVQHFVQQQHYHQIIKPCASNPAEGPGFIEVPLTGRLTPQTNAWIPAHT